MFSFIRITGFSKVLRQKNYSLRLLKQGFARQYWNMDRNRIVWVDLEMTGLNVDTCHIIEMACLITDGDLNIIAEAPNLVIHQPEEILNEMGDWCKNQHGKSGLTNAVRESDLSLSKAEDMMLDFVRKHTPLKYCPLAGSSVHEDRRFLMKYMPRFISHLHYRIIDVSTIKELCRRWYVKDFQATPPKSSTHRALDDIKNSISELQYYKQKIFK